MRHAWLWLLMGCGASEPGEPPRVFGGDRPVELKTPDALDDGRAYPLVLVLHGYGVTGPFQAGIFQLSTLPADNEALLLAPDGLVDSTGKHFWNADPVCCDFENTGVDDVAYLGGLIDDVLAAWPVDPAQVFVVGHSNGAFMGYRMACERADVITASALLAGNTSRPAAECAPSAPTSMLVMHGTDDRSIPYDGGGVSAGASGAAARWRTYDGCTGSAPGTPLELDRSVRDDNETVVETGTGCAPGGSVELWTHQGAGHVPAYNPTLGPTLFGWLQDHARP